MNDLISEGRVIRAWLGVTIQELNQDLAESLDLNNIKGILISDVVEDSPAEKAKLQSGDVIIKVNDDEVATPAELQINISSRLPGETVKLTLIRDGKTKLVSVKLDELPGDDEIVQADTDEGDIDLGFSVRSNNDDIARQYGLDTKKGVVIINVEPGSEAYQKGVRDGDRIITLEGKTIKDMNDFKDQFDKLEKKQTVLILIETKDGNKRFITVKTK
jgi:serine protease Do